jgi:hypothetical protein
MLPVSVGKVSVMWVLSSQSTKNEEEVCEQVNPSARSLFAQRRFRGSYVLLIAADIPSTMTIITIISV